MAFTYGHLALFVTDLREAEDFYTRTFGMDVAFREAEDPDGAWYTLPSDKGWDDAEHAGVEIGMVALQRDKFILPIFPGQPEQGTVLEIGIKVPAEEIEAISSRLPEAAIRRPHEFDDLFFEDPFGFLWHVNTTDQGFLSNGEIAGHWLDI